MADLIRQVDETISRMFRDMGDSTFSEVITAVGDQVAVTSVSIGAGASLSAGVDLGVYRVARITFPATWTTADLTFQVSEDGITWSNLYDSFGTEYKVVGSTGGRTVITSPSDFLSIRYIKIRSGTSGAAVNQVSAATLVLTLTR